MAASRKSWADALSAALVSGALASLASAAALALAGKRELEDAAAPLNGPSQWVWGRHAPHRDGFSLRHTVVGYGVHHMASVFWAVLFERLREKHAALPAAIVTSTVAGIVDLGCTPPRFTPGFERRLARGALVAVYSAFAAGLAASSFLTGRSKREPRRGLKSPAAADRPASPSASTGPFPSRASGSPCRPAGGPVRDPPAA